MYKLFHRTQKQVGLPPGSIVFAGKQKMERVKTSVVSYNAEHLEEWPDTTLDDALAARRPGFTTWINVDGLHDADHLKGLGEQFGIHPLVLEDIINVNQRSKVDDYEDYLYIVVMMIRFDADTYRVHSEQVSVVLGDDYVLSFQEEEGDVFEPVRERIRSSKGRIRRVGADYLAYALLDAIVDNYFTVLEKLNERIEDLEEPAALDPGSEVLREIHKLKRDVIYLRKLVRPMRDVASELLRSESAHIKEGTVPFLRDLYDHTIRVVDVVDAFRDALSGVHDLYLSSVSNRMNEVMKVLTIAATMFVPLTFVAGIYGMNFEVMPELGWKWGYLGFWVVVLILSGGMLVFFRRKNWI